MSSEYLCVDKNLQVVSGEEAKKRLMEINDTEYYEEDLGVARVPKARWNLAQEYEFRTWMNEGAHASDDRNSEHSQYFMDYDVLKGRTFNRAIELGCGPFTNLRVIGKKLHIRQCVLLDPLLNAYQEHRNCSYPRGRVLLDEKLISKKLSSTTAGRLLRMLLRSVKPSLIEEFIPVERMMAVPIEEIPECGSFDLVVMINVIEHCYDVNIIFSNILRIAKTGSVFIFHDRLFNDDQLGEDLARRFDAGHPIRIDGGFLKSFLFDNFNPLYSSEVMVEDKVGDIDLSEMGIYFIGVRK